jgi:hypothetical protein
MLQAKYTQSGSTSSKVTRGYAKGRFLKGPKRKKKGLLRQSAVKRNFRQSEFDTRELKYESASELAFTSRL